MERLRKTDPWLSHYKHVQAGDVGANTGSFRLSPSSRSSGRAPPQSTILPPRERPRSYRAGGEMRVRAAGLGTLPSFSSPLCLRQSRGMLGGGILVEEGSTPQISWAYSVMVLSLENLPEQAMFLMTFFVHSRGSWEEGRQGQQSRRAPAICMALNTVLWGC